MIKPTTALVILLAAALPSFAAIAYETFSHPGGDYSFEYPADWKQTFGMEAVHLAAPGVNGRLCRIGIERYPLGVKDPQTPALFIDDAMQFTPAVRKLAARDTIKVSGRDVERLIFIDTVRLKGPKGTILPGPKTEVDVIVPQKKGYYVLSLIATGSELASARREFDRLVAGIHFRPNTVDPLGH